MFTNHYHIQKMKCRTITKKNSPRSELDYSSQLSTLKFYKEIIPYGN